jgi:hypothetical protein
MLTFIPIPITPKYSSPLYNPNMLAIKITQLEWLNFYGKSMGSIKGFGQCYVAIPQGLYRTYQYHITLTINILDTKDSYVTLLVNKDKNISYKIKAFFDPNKDKAEEKAREYFSYNNLDIENISNWLVEEEKE